MALKFIDTKMGTIKKEIEEIQVNSQQHMIQLLMAYKENSEAIVSMR